MSKACEQCVQRANCQLLAKQETAHCRYVHFFIAGAESRREEDTERFIDWFRAEHSYVDNEWLNDKAEAIRKYMQDR